MTVKNALMKLDPGFVPEALVCREKEESALHEALRSALDSKTGCTVWLCGTPGTGKTIVLLRVLRDLCAEEESLCVVYRNAMQLAEPKDLQLAVSESCGRRQRKRKRSDGVASGECRIDFGSPAGGGEVCQTSCSVLAVDEVENLAAEALRELVHSTAALRFVFVGVSNRLDLVTQLKPGLVACGCPPPVVVFFRPYSKAQLIEILRQRVESVASSGALAVCAGKAASKSGDARQALELCRRAMESLVERGGSSQLGESALLLSVADVVRANPVSETVERIGGLPLHAKIVLFVLARVLSNASQCRGRTAVACARLQLRLEYAEFVRESKGSIMKLGLEDWDTALTVLEQCGLVRVARKRRRRSSGRGRLASPRESEDSVEMLGDLSDVVRALGRIHFLRINLPPSAAVEVGSSNDDCPGPEGPEGAGGGEPTLSE